MKKLHASLLAACLLLFAFTANAQLAMTRTTFTSTYTPISLPSATLSTASGDDVAQSGIPIGFTFNYLGTNFTSIGVNTNGVASFDPTMSTSGGNNNLYVTNAPLNALAPWWDNIWSDTVLYITQGTSPNRTFTIQWTNSLSYFNTATQRLNFQVILYETTNVIEFSYGNVIPGTAAANESASIGLKGATGGPGNYLDAVTGSAFTSNGMLNAATQWPAQNFRFTPGAPAAIAAGTYTVGVSGNYFSLSEAIADMNHRGISGPVVLSLIDAQYDVTPANGDNFFPMLIGPVSGASSVNTVTIQRLSGTASIVSEGTNNGNCGNKAANNVISSTNEPILALVGANYVTLNNLSLSCSSTGIVDRGLMVINSSATEGSMNNTLQNITVMLNRTNAGCIGIEQRAITTPTAATGANSNNNYFNLDISNAGVGLYLNGNANFPDLACQVGTTSATSFNMIGGATANDISNSGTAVYGIRANNQSGCSIFNNEVRNISQGGNSSAEGIVLEGALGSNNIYMNKVHDVNCTATNATGNITGIRANVSNTGTNTIYVYNNFVYGIGSAYTGAATATRAVKGIWVQSLGGGANTSVINVDFNNVRLDNSSSPNLSATCFESGATNGPVINTRNNVLANFTGAQTGNAIHLAMATPTTGAIGNTGSISDYNDLYVANTTNGFTGRGATTNYATLANWQTAMTQDANSIAADPGFSATTDIHVSAVPLNGTANMTGITWVTNDIDNQVRSVSPDIGADEFVPLLLDAGATALAAPLNSGCHTGNEPVIVTIKNFASVPLDFSVDNVTVTVNVTGALTQTLTYTINNNSLNAGNPLPSGSTLDIPVGTLNMTTGGTYVFNANTTLSGDGNALNDAMSAVTINYTSGTATASPYSVCAGSSVVLTLSGASPGGTIQWQSSTDGGVTWQNETGPNATNAQDTVTPGGNTLYQVMFCGVLASNIDTITYNSLTSPTVVDDTVCGPGVANLTANGSGTIYWYAAATGGNALASGPTYSPTVSATTTFYVSNATGSTTQSVGLYDNSAGGGMSTSANNLIFDVFQNCTLDGVYVYPNAAGNVVVNLEDNTNTVINTVTVAVTASNINQRTWIPLGFSLTPGTGMQLVRGAGSVQLWRNNVGVTYPYTIPGIISITTSTAGNGFYYFFYNWQISYGCESPRVPLNVVVNTPPSITVSSTATVCAGNSTTLSVSSSNPNYTYTWTPPATLNTTTGSTVIATPTATTTYTVNANDPASGCRATDSVLVNYNFVTTPVVTADTIVCTGQADTLVASYHVGLFDNSAGGSMSASGNNLIFDVFRNCVIAGVYVYPAAAGNVVIDLEDNTNAVLNTVTFPVTAANVNQRTFVPLNFALTPATGMQLVRNATSVNLWRNNIGVTYPYDLPGILSITTSTAGGNFYYFFYNWQITVPEFTYTWTSVPTGFTASGDTVIATPTASTQYIVTVTDTVSGCTTQFSTTVNVAAPVGVTISGNPGICLGDSTLLVANTTGGDGNVTYNWSTGSTNDSTMVTPATTTTYSVTVTDGCGTTASASQTETVTTAIPTGTFTFSVSGLMTYSFTDATSGTVTYAWDFGDSNTSTSASPTHTYASQGTYTVTLIASNGCGSDTITQVIVVDGIASTDFENSVSIYPNPASSQFQVSFTNINPSAATISLYNLQGELILQRQVNSMKAGQSTMIDVSSLAKGMYMLKVNTSEGNGTFRMIVQ